jgi:hypothetical protein
VAFLSCAVAAIGVAACGNDKTSSSGSTGGADATVAKTEPAATTLDQAAIDYALKYTGGKAVKADASQAPITIGFSTQKGGTPSFPEQEAAADATVKFINEHLGGIAGRPLALHKCFIQSEEDGQKCGAQFIDKKVPLVNQALATIGNASLYKTVAGKVPVLVGTTSTGPDSTSKGVYSFTGGGPAVIFAMAKDTKNLGAQNTALVSVGNPGGKFTMEKIAEPALNKLKVKHSKTVYYADTATTPDIVSAVQAAGGSKAAVIFFDPSGPQQCASLFDALKQLGIKSPVVTTPICNADLFVGHTGAGPERWHFWGFGENPRVASSSQVQVFNDIMNSYGQSKWKYVGFASSTVRDLLTIAKFANKIGFAKLSPATMQAAILAFRGPAFMIPGPINCAKPFDTTTQSICGVVSVGSKFEAGKWSSLGSIKIEK